MCDEHVCICICMLLQDVRGRVLPSHPGGLHTACTYLSIYVPLFVVPVNNLPSQIDIGGQSRQSV